MINGLEGIPGSGKSYEASVVHVLEALKRGRKVITNLPLNVDAYAVLVPEARELLEIRTTTQPVLGTWDATRADAFELFPDGKVKPPPQDAHMFASVWDYYSEWKHPKEGFGPLFVIDECHVALNKENAGRLREVIQWFKLSRHFNVDVLLMTQTFRDVHDSIRTLIAMLIKVRKADIVGREGYVRKVHSGYRGAQMSDEIRQYDPGKFILYRSHTQGGAIQEFKATDVVPAVIKWRRRAKWMALAGVLGFVVSVGYIIMTDKPAAKVAHAPKPVQQPAPTPRAPTPPASAPQAVVTPVALEGETSTHDGTDPEPYGIFGVHLTGHMAMGKRVVWSFDVSQNGRVTHSVTDAQLVSAGYRWRPLADCSGVLEWKDKRRAITCNTPQVQIVSSTSKSS